MSASVLIKIGNVELQCTGSEEFLKEQMEHLLSFADAQSSKVPSDSSTDNGNSNAFNNSSGASNGAVSPANGSPLSISSIAAKLGVASGPDLIMAACLRMGRGGQSTFKRSEITTEMRSATAYFKATYVGNLTRYLNTLVQGGKLLEQSKDVYAQPAGALEELESRVA